VFLGLPSQTVVAIHLVIEVSEDNVKRTFHPIVPAYANTICKVQEQTLKNIVLWLDCPRVPEGVAYIALSRIRKLDDLFFMVQAVPKQFTQVQMLAE